MLQVIPLTVVDTRKEVDEVRRLAASDADLIFRDGFFGMFVLASCRPLLLLAGLCAVAVSECDLAACMRAMGMWCCTHDLLLHQRPLSCCIVQIKELVGICKEYVIALRCELKRKELKEDDMARAAELAAYFTHCNLQVRLCVVVVDVIYMAETYGGRIGLPG